jgi:hypothetical protein
MPCIRLYVMLGNFYNDIDNVYKTYWFVECSRITNPDPRDLYLLIISQLNWSIRSCFKIQILRHDMFEYSCNCDRNSLFLSANHEWSLHIWLMLWRSVRPFLSQIYFAICKQQREKLSRLCNALSRRNRVGYWRCWLYWLQHC